MNLPTTPIYYSVVDAQNFDPATVPPNQTRTERAREHDIWWQQTLKKATVKKAPRGKRGAA